MIRPLFHRHQYFVLEMLKPSQAHSPDFLSHDIIAQWIDRRIDLDFLMLRRVWWTQNIASLRQMLILLYSDF